MKKLLLLIFVLVVIPLAVYGIYMQIQAGMRINPEIVSTLITPYGRALTSGKFDEAYQNYTSAQFRNTCQMATFLKAQQENREKYGDLREIVARQSEPFQSAGNLFSGRRYYQGGLEFRYLQSTITVVWEVVREDEAYKVDCMFQEFHERLTPGIF